MPLPPLAVRIPSMCPYIPMGHLGEVETAMARQDFVFARRSELAEIERIMSRWPDPAEASRALNALRRIAHAGSDLHAEGSQDQIGGAPQAAPTGVRVQGPAPNTGAADEASAEAVPRAEAVAVVAGAQKSETAAPAGNVQVAAGGKA